MEEMKSSLTQLTGAVNALVVQIQTLEGRIQTLEHSNAVPELRNLGERIRIWEDRLTNIESSDTHNSTLVQVDNETNRSEPLIAPQSENELKEVARLPDCVKELQVFDGNPVQFLSWTHSVEVILDDYKIVKSKPIYRAILQHIRQKIRGKADAALVSYNVFSEEWDEIKKILSLHYADKRDIRTLEHQLNQLTQGNSKIDEFYASVNHQISLIINKIKSVGHSEETVGALVETYRNRALDVFIRGLNGEVSKLLMVQKPKTLPEAYTACLEVQNLNFRSNFTRPYPQFERNLAPIPPFKGQFTPRPFNKPNNGNNWRGEQNNQKYDRSNSMNNRPKFSGNPGGSRPGQFTYNRETAPNHNRETAPNYNRETAFPQKRLVKSDNYPQKSQRLFHIEPEIEQQSQQDQPINAEENFMIWS